MTLELPLFKCSDFYSQTAKMAPGRAGTADARFEVVQDGQTYIEKRSGPFP